MDKVTRVRLKAHIGRNRLWPTYYLRAIPPRYGECCLCKEHGNHTSLLCIPKTISPRNYQEDELCDACFNKLLPSTSGVG